ncbi:MAG TPA: glycosyltransferase family A protein [Propionibacteriaceae bacterium]
MSSTPVGPAGQAANLVVAVLTYRRPDDILAALPLLVEQVQSVAAPGFAVDILVVDNDPQCSAETGVRAFAAQSPVAVRYVSEPTPGISAARNRALAESADRDLLVFIDDDERPTPVWLANLVEVYRRRGPTAVVGPVVSEFETIPEPWIEQGRFFLRRRMPTETALDVAATNNLLLDLRRIRHHGLAFDLAFGIGGGEDTLFTRTLHHRGELMLWCDEAIVVDVVPTTRLTRRWVTHRAFSSGNSWSLTSLRLAGSASGRLRVRAESTARGVVRMAGGAARTVVGAATGSIGQRARGVRTIARGAGLVAGAWGYSYQEYRRKT